MRVLTKEGWEKAQVGQAFCGKGFYKVEFDAEDFSVDSDKLLAWIGTSVIPRMYPPGSPLPETLIHSHAV